MTTVYNDHNVYIVGAGFSVERGLPLISNFMFFLRDAHEWLLGQQRSEEAESVKRVLEFRLRSTPAAYRVRVDLENIEELFSLAAAIDDSLTRNIQSAIAATLDYCTYKYSPPKTRVTIRRGDFDVPIWLKKNALQHGGQENDQQFEADAYTFIVAGLLGLFDVVRDNSANAFISFNYDLLVEDALTSLGIPFSYGFGPKGTIRDESVGQPFLSRDANLKLLKLHGSTNWAFPGGQGGKLAVFRSYAEVRAGNYVPELVPPTWRKSFDGPLVHVWNEALTQISYATRLVILGFSVPPTDTHFKYLVAAGLRENISLREIVFVNPDSEGIAQRAVELFGDLTQRPSVRIAAIGARGFTRPDSIHGGSASIGRTFHRSIQSVVNL